MKTPWIGFPKGTGLIPSVIGEVYPASVFLEAVKLVYAFRRKASEPPPFLKFLQEIGFQWPKGLPSCYILSTVLLDLDAIDERFGLKPTSTIFKRRYIYLLHAAHEFEHALQWHTGSIDLRRYARSLTYRNEVEEMTWRSVFKRLRKYVQFDQKQLMKNVRELSELHAVVYHDSHLKLRKFSTYSQNSSPTKT